MIGLYVFVGMLVVAGVGIWYIQNLLVHATATRLDLFLNQTSQLLFVSWLVASAAGGYTTYLWLTRKEQAIALAEQMSGSVLSYFQPFQQLYDESPLPYFMLDASGTIERPNKAAARFLGAPSEAECEGKNFYEFLVYDEKNGTDTLLKTKLQRGVPINKQDVQVRTLTGDVRWVQLTVFVMERMGKRKRVGLAALVDITQEKEMDRMKTEFVSLASHQLRTPLTTVKWQIDYLRTSKKFTWEEEVSAYLEKIYHGNERMIELVNTLLNVSRIEMGTLQVKFEDTDLVKLCEDVIQEVSPALEEKHIQLVKEFTPVCVAQTDPNLFRIVIQNLMTNAGRYTSDGGEVRMGVACRGDTATIIVSDNGCGIPPEAQARIFTKMYRADNAVKMVAQGTGLGLYMSRAFVETLGGTIGFVSQEGKGTTFTVTLPLRKK
jgi:PAS domain S-box-containing protein